MKRFCAFYAVFLFFFTFSLLHSSSFAIRKSYIVYLGGHGHGNGNSHGPELASDLHKVKEAHSEFLASFLGSKEVADESIIYSYDKNVNGFAATLDEEEAAKIAEHPDVVSVFPNKLLKLHTTHSWEFLNLETKASNGISHPSYLWEKAKFGENVIIGNLDTGVWPESKSFSDDDGYGQVPSKWKGGCQNETIVPCNKKLIGAKYFSKGYEHTTGLNASLHSARDYDGHGSHTLSTAGGNFVHEINIRNIVNGTAKGGSPRARVAAYKVCWPPVGLGGGCSDIDIMKAFETAIQDGVDVLSISLGGFVGDYFNDGTAIGSFHAMKKGIPVVCSAGNDGPASYSVSNVAPWILTVGANTIDREFQSFVELQNGIRLKGVSLSKSIPVPKLYPLIDAAKAKAENASWTDARLCIEGALDPRKVKGKILVCLRGGNGRVEKGEQAAHSGAVGMILCNDKDNGNGILSDAHVLPATHINYTDGLIVYNYLNSTDNPMGFITNPKSAFDVKPAPFMASFSSRGPNPIQPEILKPDITAPGVNIIAAYSPAPDPEFPYYVESGTSMSCPHVSGVVGLLKSIHPDWSPSAIKSALMTTARTRANTNSAMVDSSFKKADPFAYGSGEIRPNRAMDPGLVYDLSVNDYLDFFCSLGYNETMIQRFADGPYKCPKYNNSILNFNYPSITVPKLSGTVRVARKLKNVGAPGVYNVRVREPIGISVVVEPKTLRFEKPGEEKSFELTMKAKRASVRRDHLFGELLWSDGKHYVRSPIVVQVA